MLCYSEGPLESFVPASDEVCALFRRAWWQSQIRELGLELEMSRFLLKWTIVNAERPNKFQITLKYIVSTMGYVICDGP